MADWSTLKPLRLHSQIMGITVLILLGILFLTPRHFFSTLGNQNNSTEISTGPTVDAIGGLSIREEPSLNSKVLKRARNHASIKILDVNGPLDNIDGKSGQWYKVEYKGVIGYAWGNNIKK